MNSPNDDRRYSPLWELIVARIKEFHRTPHAIFWVYGFPLMMAAALGVAFQNRRIDKIRVDVQDHGTEELLSALAADTRLEVTEVPFAEARRRLARARSDVIIVSGNPSEFVYDPNRAESVLARAAAENAMLKAKAPSASPARDLTIEEPGGRYIDFLIPGLIGMNVMGGGLWGIGFVIVDMRIRKLLKRFIATPMRRTDFLLALAISRLIFTAIEVLILLVFAYLAFNVGVRGRVLDLVALIVLGASTFAGIGLLVACRATTTEAVSGLMNLVMLPMWLLSGVFFSSERFPDAIQPIIKALPLTALNDALRSIMLDGASLASQWREISVLVAWGTISFVLALRWFRWN
jgi:ABC-2 type transport system permease protein